MLLAAGAGKTTLMDVLASRKTGECSVRVCMCMYPRPPPRQYVGTCQQALMASANTHAILAAHTQAHTLFDDSGHIVGCA